MRVVVDTNVIVSGLLTPYRAPSEIVLMIVDGVLEVCYDARILAEYREVLLRPKFNFNREDVHNFIEEIKSSGFPVAPEPLKHKLPDSDDEAFLEVSLSGGADCLITGNLKHYPAKMCRKLPVISPTDFLTKFYPKNLS